MSHPENLNPDHPTMESLKLDALEELQNHDFEHLRNSIQLMMTCAMGHEFLDHGKTRVDMYQSFKAMYNFLSKMEMYIDPEIEFVNLLTD